MSTARSTAVEAGKKEPVSLGPDASRCPQCKQYGEGVPYWRRPGRLAALIGASALTYGIGGLVCHGLWGGRRYCPHCGSCWTPVQSSGPIRGDRIDVFGITEDMVLAPMARDDKERMAKIRRSGRVMTYFVLPVAGLPAILLATMNIVTGTVGDALWWLALLSTHGWSLVSISQGAEQSVRSLSRLRMREVLALARRRGGALTVTEVATKLGIGLDAAEKLMAEMDDGFRVRPEVSHDGVVHYEFPELHHREELREPQPSRVRRGPRDVGPPEKTALARRGKWLSRLPRAVRPLTATTTVLAASAAAVGTTGGIFLTACLGLMALAAAATFGMTFWPPKRLAERYRRSLLQALDREILDLAERRGGVLTVSEVAVELDQALDVAEKLLIRLDDGSKVRSDISDEGVICFEFPEFLDPREPRPALDWSRDAVAAP